MSKILFIKEVAALLKHELPTIVTKEELMNYYIHNMKVKKDHETNITVKNLIQAAVIAGKMVKGNSILEVNVSAKEKLEYIREARLMNNRESLKKIILDSKEDIIAMYNAGASMATISKSLGCSQMTVSKYLKEFGVISRGKGGAKIYV